MLLLRSLQKHPLRHVSLQLTEPGPLRTRHAIPIPHGPDPPMSRQARRVLPSQAILLIESTARQPPPPVMRITIYSHSFQRIPIQAIIIQIALGHLLPLPTATRSTKQRHQLTRTMPILCRHLCATILVPLRWPLITLCHRRLTRSPQKQPRIPGPLFVPTGPISHPHTLRIARIRVADCTIVLQASISLDHPSTTGPRLYHQHPP